MALSALASSGPSTEDTVDLLVKIGGTQLDGEAAARLIDVSVVKTVGEAAQLTMRVAAWDSDSEELKWLDDDQFAPGSTVEVELGFVDRREKVFYGDIATLGLEASQTSRAVLTITAYDVLHRLGRGQRNDFYKKKTYAGIVRDIAQRVYSLEVDAADDSDADPEHAAVNQRSASDLEFILELAAEIGYELFADGAKLVFRRSQAADPAEITLDATNELIQFSAHLSASSQFGGVDVIALNSETKERIQVSEDNPDSADGSYGSAASRSIVIEDALATEEQAKSRAKAELERMRNRYLDATATTFGRVDITAGMVVQIDNLGTRFGGAYYVSSVTHAMSATNGLRTTLSLKGQPR